MERFDKRKTFVYGGSHKLAAPIHHAKPEFIASVCLNPNDQYRVEFEGRYWVANFVEWHGAHALFFVPKRFNYFAVWCNDLRKIVKRIKQ